MRKEMLKEKALKVISSKRNIAIGILSVALVGVMANDISTQTRLRNTRNEVVQLDVEIAELNNIVKEKEKKIDELQEKVNEAKPYFEMEEAERKQQELKVEKEKYKKYLDLVDSGKSYYDMTEEERKTIDIFFNTESPIGIYNKLSDALKEEYKEKFDKVQKDKEDSLAKIQAEKEAEEQAQKEAEEKSKAEAEAKAKEEEKLSLERKNAVKTAEGYLRYTSFSRQGLIEQLEYEGYSNDASVYAVDNVTVDWNEQCAKTAESYLKCSSFSRQGLYEQLQYEGFTEEQIKY